MSLDVILKDGTGSDHKAKISHNGNVYTAGSGVPIYGGVVETKIFRDYFRNSANAFDMRVDGSVTNVDFVISPSQVADRYISSISFVLADAGASFSLFGAIAALTNGVEIFYIDDEGKVIIADSVKTNWDLVRVCGGVQPFGTGADAFRAKDVEGKTDAYIPTLMFKDTFGLPYGVSLKSGSNQKLIIRIKDNITGVDSFNAIASGFDRLKEDIT